MKNRYSDKPQMVKEILTVKEKTFLSPHYIRIILEGNIAPYAVAKIGDNNKIVLPNSENKIIFPEMSGDRNGITIRTYTTKNIDFENNTLTIDFVAHGEEGPASSWAINSKIGDPLGVLMKLKPKPLFLPADNYFLVGDHTALPVIGAILEQLPKDARGKAIIEVYAAEDTISLEKPDGIDVEWLYNKRPGEVEILPNAVEKYILPKGSKFIYVAAEQNAANAIQQYLRNQENVERTEWQTYAYWKYGQSEDNSSTERRESMHKA
ncbi:MAG: NADPH-dependent ferric siderophore reductase [Pseudopedobacter saltans]|uniref:NADPH-dependent ferric siderophore reductase n=1 Tax=Pseudopedobacter saltans TaxID=151895 RepID=A0A2W5EDM5_9SPHI|nr:MAG: NADPH-dependent ferric siderophore reductase [Pseudopedobacter saltans]